MISPRRLSRPLALLISLATVTAPLAAQKPTPEKPKAPAPAKPTTKPAGADQQDRQIDSLLAADVYKIYGEVKNVGTQIHSGAFAELIDPVMKLADPPKEFKTLVKFLNTNAETLANSRLVFATWPTQAGVPNAFFVIELASAEEAAQFEPKLNRVLPAILPTPTPTPTVSSTPTQPASPSDAKTPSVSAAVKDNRETVIITQPTLSADTPAPPPPSFVVSRSGNLVFITDKAFKFDKLRPADSKLLTEDQNFRQARERFSTEPVFIFINVALSDANRNKALAEEREAQLQARMKAEEETQKIETVEPAPDMEQSSMSDEPAAPDAEDTPEVPNSHVSTRVALEAGPGTLSTGPMSTPPPARPQSMAFGSLLSLLGGGEPEWPDAVGIAIAQEGDDYVIRSILVGPQNGKRLVLPFVPQLLAGRGLTPNAASVLPDDTEILISASFDWPQTYEQMLVRLNASNRERTAELSRVPAAHRSPNDEKPYDPFLDFEKKGGFKIKDELLPALGNEIAFASSMKSLQGAGGFGIMMAPQRAAPKPSPDARQAEEEQLQKTREAQSAPMVLISVRDREAARRLIPKIMEGLGVGAASLIGAAVKRDDTEMVDFAGAFAYAFVDDFLIISTTPTVKHVIDSHINHQTLASNAAFRDFTRWQPREIVGQIYISPALMEGYQKAAHDPSQTIAAAMREYLLRLNPTPQAITYALSNEGFGAIHELHLPKSFVLASVAGAASATKEPPPEMNEAIAVSMLHMIASAEATYQSTGGKGSYGSLDKLVEAKLVVRESLEKYGYRFEITASGNQFEATATPVEYGKTGKLSYFIDQSGVVRSGDHGGGAASPSDKPFQ
ncbi:MAG: hypothetical protein JWM21_4352 [Acidobacteria bacterium]|nr:hypothetical protein [Acidobacteriota bacterium]